MARNDNQLQLVFDRTAEIHNEMVVLNTQLKDILEGSSEFRKMKEEHNALREKKSQFMQSIRQQYPDIFTRMDKLKVDMKLDRELLSDLALSEYVNGNTVELTDHQNNVYEPVFHVTFKKKE